MIVTSESYFRAEKGVERKEGLFCCEETKAKHYQMGHVFRIVRLTDSSQKRKFDGLGYDCKGPRIVCNLPSQGFSLNTSGLSFQCPPARCHRYPNLHSFMIRFKARREDWTVKGMTGERSDAGLCTPDLELEPSRDYT
jgi:hypothetical protein